jgi:hypothetical protein
MRNSKDKPERVLAVQIESMQSFLAYKSERLVERKCSVIVVFRFQNNLTKCQRQSVNKLLKLTSSTSSSFIALMEFRTSALAREMQGGKNKNPHHRCVSLKLRPGEDRREGGRGYEPIPRLRQSLLTLSMAMYPLFVDSLWVLCLHTITPMGLDSPGSLGYA